MGDQTAYVQEAIKSQQLRDIICDYFDQSVDEQLKQLKQMNKSSALRLFDCNTNFKSLFNLKPSTKKIIESKI